EDMIMSNAGVGTVYVHTEEKKYEVDSWKIEYPSDAEAGHIILQDLATGDKEKYSIWLGSEDLSYYYICLNNEDLEDEDEYDDVNIDAFGIQVFSFLDLSSDSRITAAYQYAMMKRQQGKNMTFQNAFRFLRRENSKLLFDVLGYPAWVC